MHEGKIPRDLGSLSTTVLFYGTYIAQHETGQVQYHS